MSTDNFRDDNLAEEKLCMKKNVITHLKYLRKRSALTLENLSQLTGISVSYLSRLESGARRLNTDLIKRLSQALDCDPAELLQDTVHDENAFVSSAEIRKIRTLNFAREKNRRESRTEIRFDLPMYELSPASNSGYSKIDLEQKAGFRNRPVELTNERDAICVISNKSFENLFPEGTHLFLVNRRNYSPETTVFIITNDNHVMLKKIWSVTPNSIQCCDIDKFSTLKGNDVTITSNAVNAGNVVSFDNYSSALIEVKNSDVKNIYQLIGYMIH